MPKSLTISIDNKEYHVIGENEELIKKSAELLNKKIQEISANIGNVPSLTKTTLAALNIADLEMANEMNYLKNLEYVSTEINKIAEFINSKIENKNYNN